MSHKRRAKVERAERPVKKRRGYGGDGEENTEKKVWGEQIQRLEALEFCSRNTVFIKQEEKPRFDARSRRGSSTNCS